MSMEAEDYKNRNVNVFFENETLGCSNTYEGVREL